MESIYNEISVWEVVEHHNIIKVFELFDDYMHNEMYLLMEKAQYG